MARSHSGGPIPAPSSEVEGLTDRQTRLIPSPRQTKRQLCMIRNLIKLTSRLDYFAFSPFWDTKSNNNVLRTQRRVENPTYGHAQEKLYAKSS